MTYKVVHRIALLLKMQHALNMYVCFSLPAFRTVDHQIIDADSEMLVLYGYLKTYMIAIFFTVIGTHRSLKQCKII